MLLESQERLLLKLTKRYARLREWETEACQLPCSDKLGLAFLSAPSSQPVCRLVPVSGSLLSLLHLPTSPCRVWSRNVNGETREGKMKADGF